MPALLARGARPGLVSRGARGPLPAARAAVQGSAGAAHWVTPCFILVLEQTVI